MSKWIECQIGDFFEFTIPGDWGEPPSKNSAVPVLRSTNFRNDGKLDLTDVVFRSISPKRLETRKVTKGDILIEKSGGSPSQPAGRVVYCDQEFNGTCSNFIEVGRVKQQFDSRYIFYLLFLLYQSGLVLKYQQQTTGIINFKLNQYKEEAVKVPKSKIEQGKIATIIHEIEEAITQTEALIAKYQRVRTGLMQDLLTKGIDKQGRIRSEATHEFKDSPLGRIPLEWEYAELLDVVPVAEYGISSSLSLEQIGIPILRMNNIKDGEAKLDELKYSSSSIAKALLPGQKI